VFPIPYEARFPVGARVRIAHLNDLARFLADWKHHHRWNQSNSSTLESSRQFARWRTITVAIRYTLSRTSRARGMNLVCEVPKEELKLARRTGAP
jgi:predicted nucleotidyltransferase